MDLTVLIAAIPSAPELIDAKAGSSILPIFGVIFAKTGILHPAFVALTYLDTKSIFCPTSEPIPFFAICGQEKLHSIISTPASSDSFAKEVHSSSFSPIIEATMILSG